MKRKWALLTGLLLALGLSHLAKGQQKVGDRWVDDNLTIWITRDEVKERGAFYYCVADTSRGRCISNLTTGVKVKVYNGADKLIWEGKATGRTRGLVIPQKLPQARYMTVEAFRSYVINKSTGTHIHQSEPIRIKHPLQ
jgi:hypothetical protein